MTWYGLIGALEQGFVYGIMVLGVYLTFRVLDFPDLTVDGSLPLGAAVTAVGITSGLHPMLCLLSAMAAGGAAGVVTALLNTKLKILHLLASILTMIALYSINIRIMSGPNVSLLGARTLLDPLMDTGMPGYLAAPLLFCVVSLAAAGFLAWFLHTRLGLMLLAAGDNPAMLVSQAGNPDTAIIVGVGLSNALVALSGGLIAQNQGAADVNMGVGTIVAGLASVIIGETVLGRRSIVVGCVAAVLGSILYRTAIAFALGVKWGGFSFAPSDLNLITAVLVVVALTIPRIKRGIRRA